MLLQHSTIMQCVKHFCVALTLLTCQLTYALKMSDYHTASYRNTKSSSTFNHFVSHNQAVYIGAIDALYQLGEDFSRQEIVNTGMVECEDGSTSCPNYNKILLVDEENSTLITCESIDGFCATRSLDDIKQVIHESRGLVVSPGTLTTEAIIAPGPLNGYADLYVAATYDFTRHSQDVYPVTRRTLNSLESVTFAIEGDAIVRITKRATPIVDFIVNYISSFTDDEFSYFVQSQLDDFVHPIVNYSFVSKISRVCHNNGNLETYSQILTQCQGTKGDYNLVQAAYLGPAGEELAASLDLNSMDKVLYGVFATNQESNEDKPSNQSALCIYKLDDIKKAFIDAVFGCLTGGTAYNMNYVEGGTPGCQTFANLDEAFAEQVKCIPTNWRYADGIEPLVSSALLEWSDTLPSSIITTAHRNHTVAFVGTAHGQMVKVHIHNSTYAREYERFSVGSPVLRDVEIEQNGEQITILTEQQLIKLQVEKCGEYISCTDCIGSNGDRDGDPYCGWCTLENRCTRFDECPMPDVSTRWLPYNSAQCVAISNITPNDRYPIVITDQQITLTVEQLPELIDGYSYQCVFNDNPPMSASKSGNELTCQTPVASRIPSVPSGEDHVTMQLYVYSTETQVEFVQRDFYFYECNTHKMCVACTNSSWACDWCIYSNKCTHDNSMCTEDDSTSIISGVNNPAKPSQHGPSQCPQLVDQDDQILISDGLSTSIMVTGENLPDPSKANNYRCILEIEGSDIMTEATRDGNDFTCKAAKFNYAADVAQLDVSLSVVWNSNRKLDDVYGFTVTLYKCAVGRPDCSRCLSSITTNPDLNCGWCSMDDVCTVQGGSTCSGGWMPANTDQNCPNPVLIQVFPPSGTLNGNTVITISGTDFGRQFSDITSVKVGNKNCSTDGLEQDYKVGSSISCKTMSGTNNVMEVITLTVTGNDGNSQQSTGDVIFTYRNPSISSIDPQEGPEAGGTIVTITGQYLDACSEISATIGSECIMNRMDDVLNSTTARCRTTSSPIDSSHKLMVTFDEVTDKESQDEFTYRPNPTVEDVQPRTTIESGGITLTVTGTGFNLAQTPQMIMYVAGETSTEACKIYNDTMMLCKTPNTKTSSDNISRRKRQVDSLGEASFGFIIGDVSDLLMWAEDNNVTIVYFPDPEYFPFEENPQPTRAGSIEQIAGRNLDAGSSERDVTVYIGTEVAEVETLAESLLSFTRPSKDPGQRCITGNMTKDTCVVVKHGNVPLIYIGTLQYPLSGPGIGAIVGPIVAACVILLVILLLVMFIYRGKVEGHKENIDKIIIQMQELETNIADDIHTAFVELQTDVTDLTSDLEGTGMPFVPHRQYAIGMFFTGLDNRPMTNDPEDCDETVENAMEQLSTLLSDKDFLMALIQILDDDKTVPNKDRLSIASMLTVLMILEDKLPYLTDVMVTLMTAQVQDAIEAEKPTILFQRTELIMEKLLSNWIALSLYDFLKDHAAFPLFLLYRAIKCQTEKGPIDIVTGKSYISLNDENIISERLKFNELTLYVVVNKEDGEQREITVLDTDSIGQVKSKILDVVYRNMPYSTRKQPWQVDLEWLHGQSGHLVLQDIDVSSDYEPGYKRINTLGHYSVPSGSKFALSERQEVPNAQVAGQGATKYCNVRNSPSLPNISVSMTDAQVEDGALLWHLVKGDDEVQEAGDRLNTVSKRKSLSTLNKRKSIIQKKHIREVTFPRLLSTKGIVQEYMDKMFAAILNTEDVPIGIKYIFDIFDGLARRHDIQDDAVLHKWKSNILPLRFWQNIITNPQIIFDINQCESVEASLSVISQAFYDAFRINDDKIAKNAAYRRLLYNRELPKYRGMVKEYYSSVTNMQRIGKATLDQDLKDICTKFTGLFSRLSTLIELHKFLVKYRTRLLEALDSDEVYEESGLSKQLLDLLPQSGNDPRYVYGQQVDLGDESAASNGKM